MRLWDFIDPAELTGYIRAAQADQERNRFTLSRFLPSRQVNDLVYRFNRGGQGLADAATFRTFDAESPIGSRPGMVRVSGELPPISRKIRLGEYDTLRLRANSDEEIRTAIFNDAARMALAIGARMELARGEALTTGRLVLAENGVVATVDFGRSGTHTVAAGTTWSNPAAPIILDLQAWVDVYTLTNGEPPGAIIASRKVRGHIARNTEIRALAATVGGAPAIVSDAVVDQVLTAYGLPPIITYDAMVRVNGTAQRVIPEDKITFVPSDVSQLGAVMYGVTAEATEKGYNLAGAEPGVVAGAYTTDDPVARWTKAAAIALPVLANPDLTFTADVLV